MSLPLLFSYAIIQKSSTLEKLIRRLLRGRGIVMIDSGAFTAHRQGKQINHAEYMEFCRSINGLPGLWGYVQLDVIGNKDKTAANLDEEVRSGLRPMPVLTVDMPVERARDLVQVNPRICVAGGLGQFEGAEPWAMNRYRTVYRVTGGKSRAHGLGFVRYQQMLSCNLTSADSSSCSGGQRFGILALFKPEKGLSSVRPGVVAKNIAHPTIREIFQTYGITKDDWKLKLCHSGSVSLRAISYAYASACVSYFSALRGMNVFHALTTTSTAMMMAMVHKYGRRDGKGANFWTIQKEKAKLATKSTEYKLEWLAESLELP